MTDVDYDSSQQRAELAQALPKLTPEQLADVSPNFVRERFEPGQTIIKQGDAADRFFIMQAGLAEVLHEDMEGHVHKVSTIQPGEYFGETGLLANQNRSATVRATSDGPVDVLALDRHYFLELIAESRATEAQVAREMIQRLINLSDYQS